MSFDKLLNRIESKLKDPTKIENQNYEFEIKYIEKKVYNK